MEKQKILSQEDKKQLSGAISNLNKGLNKILKVLATEGRVEGPKLKIYTEYTNIQRSISNIMDTLANE